MQVTRTGSTAFEWRGLYFASNQTGTSPITQDVLTLAEVVANFPRHRRFKSETKSRGSQHPSKGQYTGLTVLPLGTSNNATVALHIALIYEVVTSGGGDAIYLVHNVATYTGTVDTTGLTSPGGVVPSNTAFCDQGAVTLTSFAAHLTAITPGGASIDGMDGGAAADHMARLTIPNVMGAWGYAIGINAVSGGAANALVGVFS